MVLLITCSIADHFGYSLGSLQSLQVGESIPIPASKSTHICDSHMLLKPLHFPNDYTYCKNMKKHNRYSGHNFNTFQSNVTHLYDNQSFISLSVIGSSKYSKMACREGSNCLII